MTIGAGDRVGRYEVLGELGAGGMGQVFRARDPRVDREVAIKVLPPDVAGDPKRRARFEKEARAVGALNHPNLLTLHDVGDQDGAPYLVTELLEGETLRERLRGGPVAVNEALAIVEQVARGLAAAHERGIVHRDIKPSNLFVIDSGLVKILDFGIAKPTESDPGAVATESGVVVGTSGYMAPEQIRGRDVGGRGDLFALGVVLHEMVTGARPFTGDSSVDVAVATLHDEPGSTGDPRTDAICERCLAKQPDDRFESADALIESIQSGAIRRRTTGRCRWLVVAAGVAGAAALFASGAFRGSVDLLAEAARSIPPTLDDRAITALTPPQSIIQPVISRDGRRLVYQVSPGSAIVIHDIDQGEPKTIPQPEADRFALFDAFPDGRVLVGVIRGAKRGLFRLDLETQALEPLPQRKRLAGAAPIVSPDGDRIAYTAADGLRILAVDGSGDRLIVPLPKGERVTGSSWSPAGDAIAFVRYRTAHESGRFLLQIASADGTRIEQLPETEAYKHTVEWAEPGRLFYDTSSDAEKESVIWSVPVVDGGFAGEPRRTRELDGVTAISWLRWRGDRLFYTRLRESFEPYLIDTPAAGAPPATSWTSVAGDVPPSWVVDGRVITTSVGPTPKGGARLFWRVARDSCTLMRLDLGSDAAIEVGAIRKPSDRAAECPKVHCAEQREGFCIALVHDAGDLVFRRFNPSRAKLGEELHRTAAKDNRSFQLSSDGRRIVYARELPANPAVVVVDLDTGSTVAHDTKPLVPHDIGLLSDGGWLVTGLLPNNDPPHVLVELYAGKQPRVLRAHHTQMHDPKASPDGSTIATFVVSKYLNVWALEGFR